MYIVRRARMYQMLLGYEPNRTTKSIDKNNSITTMLTVYCVCVYSFQIAVLKTKKLNTIVRDDADFVMKFYLNSGAHENPRCYKYVLLIISKFCSLDRKGASREGFYSPAVGVITKLDDILKLAHAQLTVELTQTAL